MCGTALYLIGFPKGKTPRVINKKGTRAIRRREPTMYSTLGKFVAAGALVGALALAGTTPSYAANGRNAAFAAGVGAGLVGGAVLGGGPAYGGYYGGPRYAYGAYGYHRPYYRHRYYRHWYR